MAYDVHIVGGRTSGSMAAYILARKGYNVVISEKNDSVGLPVHCTGIISVRGMNESGFYYKNLVLNKLYGSYIIGPDNTKLFTSRDETQAYLVDRVALDRLYADMAVSEGAKLNLNERVMSRKDYKAPIIIGADGALSSIARIEKFEKINNYVVGYQEIIESPDIINDHYVRVYLSQSMFPGFFGWTVPIRDGEMICGFGVNKKVDVETIINKFIEQIGIKKHKKLKKFGGLIPLGPRKRNQKKNVILVGNAGGYVKATTGGGVYFGTLSAKVAAECIAQGRIDEYDERMREHTNELRKHQLFRRLYNISNDLLISMFLKLGKELGIEKRLQEKGDIDYVSAFIK